MNRKNKCDTDARHVTYIFTAANIDEEVLKTLSQEDLKDLFPGPENFLKRKKLWGTIDPKVNAHICGGAKLRCLMKTIFKFVFILKNVLCVCLSIIAVGW